LKLTRDSEYVIIKDARKTQREDLTDAELLKWSTPSFANYLSKRAITKKFAKPAGFPTDTTTTSVSDKKPVAPKTGVTTDLKRKVMAANKHKAPEKGIKITVGAGGGMVPKVAVEQKKMDIDEAAAVMIGEVMDTNNDEELARQMAEDIEMMNEQDMQ